MKYLNPIIILMLTSSILQSQQNFQSISFASEYGHIVPSNEFITGTNAQKQPLKHYKAFSINAAWNFKNGSKWNEVYTHLVYGVGVYGADFQNRQEVGAPIAIYGFIQSNLCRIGPLELRHEVDLGIAFNWRHLGKDNIYNVAVSLPRTAFINIGCNLEYPLSKKITVGLGMGLSHFSNGGTKRPNKGINTYSTKISTKYNFNRYKAQTGLLRPFSRKIQLDLSLFGGYHNFKATPEDLNPDELYEGVNAIVLGVYATYNKQSSIKSRYGLGLGITYDEGLTMEVGKLDGETYKIKKKGYANIELSMHLSYEWTVGRVSLLLQPGVYILRMNNNLRASYLYQRIGARLNLTDELFAGVSLRAYDFKKANFIEYTIGKRFG